MLSGETEEGATKCGWEGVGNEGSTKYERPPEVLSLWGELKRALPSCDLGRVSDGATKWGDG